MYEKFSTFLRLEALSNNLKDFGRRSLWTTWRQSARSWLPRRIVLPPSKPKLSMCMSTFRYSKRLALPITSGHARVPGIKIHDTRMIRLMEVLLHSGTKLGGWRIAAIHQAILTTFDLKAENYTLHTTALRPSQDERSWARRARRQALLVSTIGTKATRLL
jgi:hypothetical protein